MSTVRVVARIRPLLKAELDKDIIVENTTGTSVVRIPNPRNESEAFSFQFASVYDHDATQQQLFDEEVSPTVKSLFKGVDVTIFAYGVTGTGKTHTMRGGKSLADRGVIPRLLSSIYRRAKKIERDTAGETKIDVSMSYYEIYCDRVYDLFESPDKRTPAGLPIRDNGGKTVVVGLTERPCTTLKEFEQLYDQANVNRSTSATKLNAHSSRSHAILSVKVTQTTGDEVRVSSVSAIDLAGSEDNRRTDNGKDRMVESSAINKSLFVLAQCVEAISKKQSRIPYRESRMTRILSLGQNNGVTIMILNLAPVRSYHLDTLSSLNFANRTKKIEVNEVENQPMFRAPGKAETSSLTGPSMNRQPLRPKNISANIVPRDMTTKADKPVKSFMVYAEKSKPSLARTEIASLKQGSKRSSSEAQNLMRPTKIARTTESARPTYQNNAFTAESIEAMIERKVNEKLASATMNATVSAASTHSISKEVQARLDALEQRVGSQETERSEGLQYLLMAKQHQVRGEENSALKMYQLALPFFPGNEKLNRKILSLQDRLTRKTTIPEVHDEEEPAERPEASRHHDEDASFHDDDHAAEEDEDDSFLPIKRQPKKKKLQVRVDRVSGSEDELSLPNAETPRTKELLKIINTRDVGQIRLLKGVGAKKAEMIVNCLCEMEEHAELRGLSELGKLKGVGVKGVEKMREGLAVGVF
ncbi:P-loop containing nucleoside triphosphate hydrolase protein [Elsinoe ampelina]|uniref:P-loop containing nucleoside triphosphate hydrolase protein n=1 Tax=Elsinoe ampelina TaxID=302913 RepID=A0A6A6GQA7_9PEZI|nr:P-loop containing nucleoside triphosphate hydrolase protein [Elsinoe ampelina]